jgi:hypothetical protein
MARDFGLTADNPRPRPLRVYGRLSPLPVREYGLFVNVIVAVDRTRMRTVRGHGLFESVSGIEPEHDRGQAASAAMSDTYCEAVPCLHRDQFAEMKTCHPAGVGRASSKTGKFMPCECHHAASSTGADWITFRMQLDTLTGHFPFRQCCHPPLKPRVSGTPARSLICSKSAVYEW